MTVARAIRTVSTLGVLLALGVSAALADSVSESDAEAPQSHSTMIPDIRGDDLPTKVEKGHFVIVPIPMSNPTLGSGLVVGAAYFYPQSAAQQQVQPASGFTVGIGEGSGTLVFVESTENADIWMLTLE